LLGWSMRDHHHAALVTGALDAAVAAGGHQRMPDTIFHTDRGADYPSSACVATCARLGCDAPWAAPERASTTPSPREPVRLAQIELVDRFHYRTRAKARAAIFAWIHWYNHRRLPSTIGELPPIEWERRYALAHPLPSTTAA
jgi:transposase InsO family protein